MGRVNSAKRFLWVALTYGSRFRVNKLELKTKYCIMFLLFNLLTRAKEPGPAAKGSRICPSFLTLYKVNYFV
ncbi:hypothetical protein MAL01_09195 [Leptospira noguchii]|uniref:hypothetical protein n=1 Tax=Leptospira noguchii TaxID=28182 RepID=UPI001FB67ED6|nr:hypothetical protein [Leptospira noguchii]UOG43670.1 hypothetical protein MAL01_09195 [Leptospira noguchii]